LPAEILHVVYAKDLRKLLTSKYDEISVYTFTELIFESIEQEIVVIVCNKKSDYKGIRVVELSDINSISDFKLDEIPFIKASNTTEKWTQYFTNENEIEKILKIKYDPKKK